MVMVGEGVSVSVGTAVGAEVGMEVGVVLGVELMVGVEVKVQPPQEVGVGAGATYPADLGSKGLLRVAPDNHRPRAEPTTGRPMAKPVRNHPFQCLPMGPPPGIGQP
jgi:hypothetical protein